MMTEPITITTKRLKLAGKGYIWRASALGISVKNRASPLCNLARKLIEADPSLGPRPWQLVRNGQIHLHGPSLIRLAGLTTTEPDDRSVRTKKFTPREF